MESGAELQPLECAGSARQADADLNRVAVLIPAWQPDSSLINLVNACIQTGLATMIIVDDGSSPECQPIFEQLARYPEVHLVRHAVNLGKGRALKTGMNYFLNAFPGYVGILTADADGQHTPQDILKLAAAFVCSPHRFMLGSRQFSAGVPLRSRFGNVVTRNVFRVLTGRSLSDTQSGLRAIPASFIPELLALPGERYDYEMEVLTAICRSGRPLAEVPIETIYLAANHSSHFNPLRDSMRIYFVLLRFFTSSLLAAAIDFAAFTIAFWASGNLALSVVTGRLSSLANFALNRKFVFNSKVPVKWALLRYYSLAAALAFTAWLCIRFLNSYGWPVLAAKLTVESLLWLVSFSLQRLFVFAAPAEE